MLNGNADETYNVGSERATSISQLASVVSECVTPQLKCEILEKPDLNVSAPRYIPSTEKARNELGLRLRFLFTEKIRRIIQWADQASIR